MVRRFVHFGVLCIEKYRYGENSAANLNLEKSFYYFKSPDNGLKNAQNVFQNNTEIIFF
jgi:hypothetical protein